MPDNDTQPRNIVICCDGTGNELGRNLSNVLKLYRILKKNDAQLVYYDPGVGTVGRQHPWARFRQNFRKILGLATGYGLDDNVMEAYAWLCINWREGDRVWFFGFSRGAYSVRVLAGLVHMIGLLRPEQLNMRDYALKAYKRASQKDDLEIAWHFSRVIAARSATIHFVGVWDTVASVFVPRFDRLRFLSRERLPYTLQNPSVAIFRHALAIDERRAMFRAMMWKEPQKFVANPFGKSEPPDQDVRQMWFAGVHSDIGGGYPENESALSKFPLIWMVEEAKEQGLRVNTAMVNHLVRGKERKGSSHVYVKPDHAGKLHNSLTLAWWPLEFFPKKVKHREWQKRFAFLGRYIPFSEPRLVSDDAEIHASVIDRIADVPGYDPPNLSGHTSDDQSGHQE